jgi:hypothetical protein
MLDDVNRAKIVHHQLTTPSSRASASNFPPVAARYFKGAAAMNSTPRRLKAKCFSASCAI